VKPRTIYAREGYPDAIRSACYETQRKGPVRSQSVPLESKRRTNHFRLFRRKPQKWDKMAKLNRRRRWRGPALGGRLQRGVALVSGVRMLFDQLKRREFITGPVEAQTVLRQSEHPTFPMGFEDLFEECNLRPERLVASDQWGNGDLHGHAATSEPLR
jgi:hypothetical protein